MAELKGIELGEAQPGEVNELIDHWIQDIDDWVRNLDQRMGGTAKGADLEANGSPPDPAPRLEPDAPPVAGAG